MSTLIAVLLPATTQRSVEKELVSMVAALGGTSSRYDEPGKIELRISLPASVEDKPVLDFLTQHKLKVQEPEPLDA